MQILAAYAGSIVTLLALDFAWLGLVAGAIFKSQLGPTMRAQPDLVAAGAFYLIYAAGLVVLVVAPALRARSAMSAGWRGAALGLTAYSTFDLSNLAVLQPWTLSLALMDMTWGTLLTALSAMAGYWAGGLVQPASSGAGALRERG